MAANRQIEDKLRAFVVEEFLGGADDLSIDSPLITSGVLDSVSTLTLVTFLEDEFDVTIAAHETDVENFNTISTMARFVRSKMAPSTSGSD